MTQREKDKNLECLHDYYCEYYELILHTAMALLGNLHLAEVVVQETFVTAIRYIDKLKASPNPTGWLLKVAKNKCKHAQRDVKKMAERCVPYDDLRYVPPDGQTQTDDLLIDLEEEANFLFLTRLYIYGESIKEIAESEGISIGACKMRIARAKKRLKEKYEKDLKN